MPADCMLKMIFTTLNWFSHYNDNDNDNELCILIKSNEKHHKDNINNTYKNTNIITFVPRRLHLKSTTRCNILKFNQKNYSFKIIGIAKF